MYTPLSSEPQIASAAIRPADCLKDAFALIKDQYWVFFGIAFVGGLLAGFTCTILYPAMMCGFALCYLAKARRQVVQFDLLFKGFDYFGRSALLIPILLVTLIVVSVPNFGFAFATNPAIFGGRAVRPTIGLQFVSWGVQLVTSFFQTLVQSIMLVAACFIVDRGLPAVDALRAAFRVFVANVGGFIVLQLLATLLNMAGFMACCVGVFFVAPVIYGATLMAYLQAVPPTTDPNYGAAPPPPPSEWRPPYG